MTDVSRNQTQNQTSGQGQGPASNPLYDGGAHPVDPIKTKLVLLQDVTIEPGVYTVDPRPAVGALPLTFPELYYWVDRVTYQWKAPEGVDFNGEGANAGFNVPLVGNGSGLGTIYIGAKPDLKRPVTISAGTLLEAVVEGHIEKPRDADSGTWCPAPQPNPDPCPEPDDGCCEDDCCDDGGDGCDDGEETICETGCCFVNKTTLNVETNLTNSPVNIHFHGAPSASSPSPNGLVEKLGEAIAQTASSRGIYGDKRGWATGKRPGNATTGCIAPAGAVNASNKSKGEEKA